MVRKNQTYVSKHNTNGKSWLIHDSAHEYLPDAVVYTLGPGQFRTSQEKN